MLNEGLLILDTAQKPLKLLTRCLDQVAHKVARIMYQARDDFRPELFHLMCVVVDNRQIAKVERVVAKQ